MGEIIRSTIEKLKERKLEFIICVVMMVIFQIYLRINILNIDFKENEGSKRILICTFTILQILLIRFLVFKDELRDLFHPKVLINILLIVLLIRYKVDVNNFIYENYKKVNFLIPKAIKIIYNMFYTLCIFSLNKNSKYFISVLDLFKFMFNKRNFITILFPITLMLNLKKLFWIITLFFVKTVMEFRDEAIRYLFLDRDFLYTMIKILIFSIIVSFIYQLLVLFVYNIIKKNYENEATKYLKGKFSILSFQLIGIGLAIAVGLKLWIKDIVYISSLEMENIVIIILVALFIFYLIKEFEIKRILNIFYIESKKGLICGENLKSFLLMLLKIAVLFTVGGIIIKEIELPKFIVYLIGIAILIYISIVLYSELTIKFVKGRVPDELKEDKKKYNWFKKIIILLVVIAILNFIELNVFEEIKLQIHIYLKQIEVIPLVIIALGILYLVCNLVYEILEENRYLEEEKSEK